MFVVASPKGSMSGRFTYIWLNFYGECRYINIPVAWILWDHFGKDFRSKNQKKIRQVGDDPRVLRSLGEGHAHPKVIWKLGS